MKRRFLLGSILLTIGTTVVLFNFLAPEKAEPTISYANPLDTEKQKKVLFQKNATKFGNSREKEIHRENTWASSLTEEEVDAINNFVGSSKTNQIKPLPNKGYKVSHQGKYRHGIVIQKQQDGSISQHEVGPNGIHDTSSNQTK